VENLVQYLPSRIVKCTRDLALATFYFWCSLAAAILLMITGLSQNNMQYTKSMIDLIFQIRKAAPAPIRPRIKLSSSSLLVTLTEIYSLIDDQSLRMMIFELMSQAGPEWVRRLRANSSEQQPQQLPVLTQQVASSSNSAQAAPTPSSDRQEPAEIREKVVIYRGRRLVVPA
jgi:hypothetical protein